MTVVTFNTYVKLGWTDRMNGRPFHPNYRKWVPGYQRSYENGRLFAAVAQSKNHNGPPPAELFDLPLEVSLEVARECPKQKRRAPV